ncbi:MAG: antibiotic biosynthesis monooxygenase [Rhodospirillales bacterium]|nr:antibiotic biosynthesis monooxygenase [Rhodospirillales bacterium]
MAKLAIVATIKIAPGRRDEYLKHLRAHAVRCRANEPGTRQFDILTPQDDADAVMLYEVYANAKAFQAYWDGESMKQVRRDGDPALTRNAVGALASPVELIRPCIRARPLETEFRPFCENL